VPEYRFLRRFSELVGLLEATTAPATGRGKADALLIDAFLAAAGLSQMCEDWVQREFLSLSRVRRHLPETMPLRDAAGKAVRGAEVSGASLRSLRAKERLLVAWRDRVAGLTMSLARQVTATFPGQAEMSEVPPAAGGGAVAAPEAAWLVGQAERLPPGLLEDVVRPPNCFRGFDQRPVDSAALVERVARRWPDRHRPVLVLGLRTSGSYLAPLTAACLERAGYRSVAASTMRPGQRSERHLTAALSRVASGGGLVAIVDDPPRTGSALERARRQVVAAGVAAEAVVPVLAVFDESRLPDTLGAAAPVTLGWDGWEIARLLSEPGVAALLADVLVGRSLGREGERCEVASVGAVRVLEPAVPRRAHSRCVVEVDLAEAGTGRRRRAAFLAEGVGLGYMGADARAVAERLAPAVPAVHGVSRGVLVRDWLPAERRIVVSAPPGPAELDAVVSYVARRARALPAPSDLSASMAGRGPVVEEAAAMIGDAFGRAALPARPLVQAAARRLLAVSSPAVIDADVAFEHFFRGEDGSVVKVNFAEAPSSRRERYCFDPVFDMAEAAAEAAALGNGSGEDLRASFARMTSAPVSAERWLLYLLYHHRVRRRAALAGEPSGEAVAAAVAAERLMAEAVQSYLGATYAAELHVAPSGELCAVDVDGVLETRWLGAPAASPRAVLALRALSRHGYRAVLATGRSVGEVRSRCAAYRLAGGVAEYGSAAYDAARDAHFGLVDDDGRDALEALSAAVATTPRLFADPAHRFSLRVRRLDGRSLGGLGAEAAAELVERAGVGGRVRAVPALTQTDFVASGIDKGRGLSALAEALGGADGVALVVGDGAEDAALLAPGRAGWAPAGAESALLAAGAKRLSRPAQAGLAEAVDRLVGHGRRRCAVCGPGPAVSPDAALLGAALDALGGRKREKAEAARRLARRLRR
jgi:hydroxymethylpyrimidine pyrophosphatase-like HAD family hydrolase